MINGGKFVMKLATFRLLNTTSGHFLIRATGRMLTIIGNLE